MIFRHINLVVEDPELSCEFYKSHLLPNAQEVWLGSSLHLRTAAGDDLAFQKGTAGSAPGSHLGFIADSAHEIDALLLKVTASGCTITDDCSEDGFRSIKFLDPDRYEVEVYWELGWPPP